METTGNAETVYSRWQVSKDQVLFVAVLIPTCLFILTLLSFWGVYVYSRSTNVALLIVPIVIGIVFLATVPELLKSLRSTPLESEISVTSLGIYRKLASSEEQKFIPWSQMNGYDMKYFSSPSFLGKLFPRPTKFYLKSKYEEDNFEIDAFNENVDILRAYLKESNVPFGFLK